MKKNLFKYILPAAMVAGFLCLFVLDLLHYKTNVDDTFNDESVSSIGIAESIKLFFSNINGRWFSHLITAPLFAVLKHNYTYYAIYVTCMMLLFVASVSILHKTYLTTFYKKNVDTKTSISFAFVFTATLYFLLFVGRQEIWAWVSSANNHLLSVILGILLFSFLLTESPKKSIIVFSFLLAAFIGGLNEVNAVCTALCVAGLFFVQKKYYPLLKLNTLNMLVVLVIIATSLSINIFSGGYENRMNTLPNFTLPQSIKNTVHTFALPIMQYRFIVLRLFALLTFLFFLDTNFSALQFTKQNTRILLGALVISSISFFLHCYILSDIVPARGEVWTYTFLLFLLFAFITKHNLHKQL